MQPIPFSAPSAGQNDLTPLAQLEAPYCEKILNFNLDDGNAILRNGDSSYGSTTGSNIRNLSTYGVGTGEKLLTLVDSGASTSIFNNTTPGAPIGIYSLAGATADVSIQTLYFNGYLIYFGESALTPANFGNPQYNGIAGSLSGYVYPSIVPFGGGVYKNRAYFIGRESSKYGYSKPNSISGDVTEVDLAQVIGAKGFLYVIRSTSQSEGASQEVTQCFIMNTGEVLAFSGSYPNSADWSLVRRFIIPAPVDYNSAIEANGDTFVITKSSLVSLRTLFGQGVDVAVHQGISAAIRKRWAQIFQSGISFNGMKGVFDQAKERIVITLRNFVERDGSINIKDGMRLVYSFRTNSWTEQRVKLASTSFGFFSSSTAFNNSVIMATQNSVKCGLMVMEGATDFVDAQVDGATGIGYEYEITSAPAPNSKAYVQKAESMDVIIKSDLYAETDYQLIGDLGVSQTAAQKIPPQASTLQKPNVNMGLEGSYIQYKISGTTSAGKSVGYQLYGSNLWIQSGTSPR